MSVCSGALRDMFGCTELHGEFSIPAFVVSLEQCSGQGCQEAMITSVGYKFVAYDSNGKTTICDVDQTGDALETGCVAMGAQADLWMDLVANLGQYAQTEHGDYEVRMLSVPGLLVDAIWLHSDSDDEMDLVIPAAPLDEQLKTEPLFDMDTFLDIIRDLSAERLRHSDI